jgi:hypothetical protein
MLTIQIDNTSLAVVSGVKNALTDVYDDGANIVLTLLDSDGAEVPPQSWPAQLFNESPGQYGTTLQADLDLQLNHVYTAVVDGVGSGGEVMHIEQAVQAKIRGSTC